MTNADARLHALGRLGSAVSGRPILVLGAWIVLLLLTVTVSRLAGGTFSDNVDLPNTQSHTGAQLLTANEPTASGATGTVVFHVSSGSLADKSAAIEQSVAGLRSLPHVLSATDPLAAPASGQSAQLGVECDIFCRPTDRLFGGAV